MSLSQKKSAPNNARAESNKSNQTKQGDAPYGEVKSSIKEASPSLAHERAFSERILRQTRYDCISLFLQQEGINPKKTSD